MPLCPPLSSTSLYTHIKSKSIYKSVTFRVRAVLSSLSSACFLISSNDALMPWRTILCSMETSWAIVPPKWLKSGWGGSCLSRSRWHGQSRCTRQAPLFCLSSDLTTLEERVEGGGPEAGFEPWQVKVIWGGSLAMEAESSTGQSVVAAAVVAAVAVETWAVAGRRAWLAGMATGDGCRACSVSGHPGQGHINQGSQEQAHCHWHTESYDQRDCEERNTNTLFTIPASVNTFFDGLFFLSH